MIERRCTECSKNVEWVFLGINLCLFILKFWTALFSYSKSLLADSFQSLANFIISVVVIVSLRIASRNADERFPYGYGKVEFLASGIVNMLLLLAALVFVGLSFGEMLVAGPERPPNLIAVIAAAISVVANRIAFGYGRCAGEKLGSPAILVNAEVSRADMGTSIAVIVAVIGSNLGFSNLDHIAGIIVGVLIIKVTLDGIRKAVGGLMDVSLHLEERHIRNLIEDIDGVECVGDVRARLSGRALVVDADVFVPPDRPLDNALKTIQKIDTILRTKIKSISEVSIQLLPFGVIVDQANTSGGGNLVTQRVSEGTYVPHVEKS